MHMRHFRRFVYGLVLLVLGIAAPVHASGPGEVPSAFVTDIARKALLLSANSPAFATADRQMSMGRLLDTSFDVPQIASFVLGHHWHQASQIEREAFTNVLRSAMLRSISTNFTGYGEGSFRVIGQRADGQGGTVVRTEFSRPAVDQPMTLDWHVVDRVGYRVVDMSVAGVSMAKAKRDEFASYLRANGGDLSDLTHRLQVIMSAQKAR
jgi:ABC-type transporter MlaC component